MKNIFLKNSKKSIAIIMALVMLLSFTLTGCSVGYFLQELATDYIRISVNHELLSESYKNEPLYIYQINAVVSNDYITDLTDATVSLNLPEDVEIIEGEANVKENLSCWEEYEYHYSWKVSIEPTVEDRNIDYSVSVSSQLIETVSTFASVFVEGRNEDDNRLDFSVDTWNFENYTVKPIPITQEDYDALFLDLNNTERETIKQQIKNGAGGQCYGMAITTILAKSNRLDLNRLQNNAPNLHSVSKNKASQSAIAYYYLTQFLNPAKDKIAQYVMMSKEQKLKELIELSTMVESGGTPVLLCFYLNDGGGHAVVAFGCESCNETYAGATFNNRILIYDNNFPNNYEYLYYNDNGDWEILYKDNDDTLEKPYNTSSLGLITASMELIDISNIEQNRKSVYSYITSRNNEYIKISSNGTTWKINGTNTNGAENVVAYYDIDAVDNSNLNIAIKRDAAEAPYTVKSLDEKTNLDVSINYDNFYISAKADGDDNVNLSPSGSVYIEGKTTDYNLSITANEGYAPLVWSTVTIDAENGINPKLEVTDNGYILSGENLDKINVYAENAATANELTLSTKETTVLLAQDGENLCVKSDEDKDGQYETILVTGTAVEPHDPTSDGGLKFEPGCVSGSIDLWIIILIAGTLLASIISAVIITLHSKKKKTADKFEIPVIDNSGLAEQKEDTKVIVNGIQVLTGNMKGHQFELEDGKTYTIGKDANLANILFDTSYNMVSRLHCTITYNAKFDKYFVIDCSSNGIYFENGIRLSKNVRTQIARGTVLKLANDSCRIKFL